MSDVRDWLNNLPIFTRWWMCLSVAFSLLARFGLLNGYYLILQYEPFIHGFQIWRPVTAVFYYPLNPSTGFTFLINLYFIYIYSLRLEKGIFDGRPADYLFMLLFNWICCVILALLAEIPLLMDTAVLSVLYVWCLLNPDVIVSFWFGTQFKAVYLPWVLFALNLIILHKGIASLIGLLVGHLYFFLMFKYPLELGGRAYLHTPSFLYTYFPNRRGVTAFGEPTRSQTARPPNAGRHDWGRGQVLGGQ